MEGFAERLGITIHWIGFVIGLLAGGTGVYGLYMNVTTQRSLDGSLQWEFIYDSLLLIPVFFLLPLLAGWFIRWLLVGKTHFLPFK